MRILRVFMYLMVIAALTICGCGKSTGKGQSAGSFGDNTAPAPTTTAWDGVADVAITSSDVRSGALGLIGLGNVLQVDVVDVTVEVFVRLDGKNSKAEVGSGFEPRLHPSYAGGAEDGRGADYYKSYALRKVQGDVYSCTVDKFPRTGKFRFGVSLKGGPEAVDVTKWMAGLEFDSAAYFATTADRDNSVNAQGGECWFVESDHRFYFQSRVNPDYPTPTTPPPAPPPPVPTPNYHFKASVAEITSNGGTYYITYDLKTAMISQGDVSSVDTTSHGLCLIEYLGSVDSKNHRVRVYVYLGPDALGENNTPTTGQQPYLFRAYDSVAEVNRPPADYVPLALNNVPGTDLWVAEVTTFPATGKVFLNFSKDGSDASSSTVWVRGMNQDSAHDASAVDKLGFWIDAGGVIHSLHN